MTTMQEFRARGIDMTAPGEDIVPIDLSSTDATPTVPYRGIYVGGDGTSGNLKVDTLSGSARTFYVLAGTYHPIIVTKVYRTGTAATNLFGIV